MCNEAMGSDLPGRVTDAKSGQALPGASVLVVETGQGTASDPLGRFTLIDIEPGNYTLEARYLGYATQTLSISVGESSTEPMILKLEPSALDLKELTVRHNTNLPINYLSAVDWNMRSVTTGQDMLRMVPGLFIAQHAGGGKAEQLFLRGFDLDHGTDVYIDVDGMPVNMVSHAHGQGYADAHFIIPETVQKMEYELGLGDVRNGNLATAGAISYRLLPSIEQSSFQLEAGSFNSYRALAMINLLGEGARDQGHSAYAGGSFRYADGPFQPSQGLTAYNGIVRYRIASKSGSVMQWTGLAFNSSWNASGLLPPRAVENGMVDRFGTLDSAEGGNTSRYNAGFSWMKPLTSGILDAELAYSRYTFDLISNFTYFLDNPIEGDRILQTEKRHMSNGRIGWLNEWSWMGRAAPFEVAAGFRGDLIDDLTLGFIGSEEMSNNPTMSGAGRELNTWVYAAQSFSPAEGLILETGLRADHFNFGYRDDVAGGAQGSTSRSILSPRIKADYSITDRTALFAKAGKGFHSNDLRVLISDEDVDPLAPAYGVDFGTRLKPTSRLLLQLSTWYLYSSSELVYVGDGGFVEAGDPSNRMGVDLSLRAELTKGLTFDVDGNLSRARSVGAEPGEDRVPLAAWFTSTGGLEYKHKSGLGASLRYRAVADRPADESGEFIAEGFMLLDASLRYDVSRWSVWLRGENLLNRDWKEAQFLTTSLLPGEMEPVDEVHFTPGFPLGVQAGIQFRL